MPKALTAEQVERYHRDGFLFPVRVLSEAETARYRGKVEAYETVVDGTRRIGGRFPKSNKLHLVFTWANELVRHPGILDVVEDIIGPNLLVWGNSMWIKEAHDPSFVSWHQDSTYWGLEPLDVVSVWLALTEATVDNGAMQFAPGSHAWGQLPHTDTTDKTNMLSRGQTADVAIDAAKVVDVVLRPGEISLHHIRMLHGSKANRSGGRRIGMPVRYIPPHVHQAEGRGSAKLVRGVDTHVHFDPEPDPKADLDAAAIAFHNAAEDRQGQFFKPGDPRRLEWRIPVS